MSITVYDLNIVGKFIVKDITKENGKVIHRFDGDGYGDMPFDISYRKVLALYAKDNVIVVEV